MKHRRRQNQNYLCTQLFLGSTEHYSHLSSVDIVPEAWRGPKDSESVFLTSPAQHQVHTQIDLNEKPSGKRLQLSSKEMGGCLGF